MSECRQRARILCFYSINSSWTFLTTILGHTPQGYVLSFSITSLMIFLMLSLSGAVNASDFTTTALLL